MRDDQTTEYITALVIGAALGVGATLLFAPDPPTRGEKLMKELEPYRKRLKKGTSRAREQVGRQASAAAEWSEEMVAAGRSVIGDIREEVADLVAEARHEIAAAVEGQVEAAQQALRKGARRVGR
jgi:gas vesicle protein